jgi:type I restriction enzyme, S subunit
VELSELCELIVDCEHKTAPTQSEGYPSIRTPNIGRGYFLLDGVNRVSEETYRLWTRRAVPRAGDLIMAREAPVGNVAIIPPGLQLCLGQRTLLIRPDRTKIDPTFLNYFLNGPHVQGVIFAKTNGATVAHLNMQDVRTLPLPQLPSPDEQRRIAEILSAYDALIENCQRRIRILEEMARKFSTSAIPQRSETKKLGEIAEDVRRNVPKGKLEKETPYVGLEHIPRRSLALDSWEMTADLGSNKLEFKKGEILFGKIRPYFHKVSIAPFDGLCSADTIVIRAHEPEYFPFVAGCVSSDAFVAHASATANGAKMPRANWDVLKKYEVVIPKGNIARQFSALFTDITSQQQTLVFQIKNLRRTRDLLLPRLLSGK